MFDLFEWNVNFLGPHLGPHFLTMALIDGEGSHQLSRSGSAWSGLARQATFSTGINPDYSRFCWIGWKALARVGRKNLTCAPRGGETHIVNQHPVLLTSLAGLIYRGCALRESPDFQALFC